MKPGFISATNCMVPGRYAGERAGEHKLELQGDGSVVRIEQNGNYYWTFECDAKGFTLVLHKKERKIKKRK